jgi:RNA polymerase sigma factor (sigma-70 family)
MSADRPTSLADRAATAFAAYQGGDEAAMSDLVGLLTPLLWHTARSQGLDAGSAEDVVQTAWLRLYQHAASISDPQAVLKWVVTTTRREAWSVSRAGRRADLVAEPAVDLDRATAPADAPDATVLRGETQRMLWRHLKLLPERCQSLLRVIAVADRPDYAAIAESLGMPVGSIGPTRGRCLAKLRAALESDPAWGVTA